METLLDAVEVNYPGSKQKRMEIKYLFGFRKTSKYASIFDTEVNVLFLWCYILKNHQKLTKLVLLLKNSSDDN